MKPTNEDVLERRVQNFAGNYALKVWSLCWKYISIVFGLALWKVLELGYSAYTFVRNISLEKVFDEYLIGTLFFGCLLLWFIGSPSPRRSIKRFFQKR
jgi:hypothetical protein